MTSGPEMSDVDLAELADLALDADSAPLAEVGTAIRRWAGRLAAGTCLWLCLLAAFDRRGGWKDDGRATCADWLAWQCGISERTARAHLAVAHALRRLPVVRRAFARGQLSYAKVRALCRVADADTERGWVERAHTSTADELEDLVTSHRQRHADPHAEHRARRLRWRTRADGMVTFSAVMPAHDAARVTAALPPSASASTRPHQRAPTARRARRRPARSRRRPPTSTRSSPWPTRTSITTRPRLSTQGTPSTSTSRPPMPAA